MSKVELSRRGFLKGTLAATGAAMAGTAAHAGDIPEKWQQPKCSGWSWEKPAAKIAPEQIKKTVDTDVVVIGAGLAGFAAALGSRSGRCQSRFGRKNTRLELPRRSHHRIQQLSAEEDGHRYRCS